MSQFNAFGAKKGIERHSTATATGRGRTDPYSVSPLRAAEASRCA
jgi:hypothetical protein